MLAAASNMTAVTPSSSSERLAVMDRHSWRELLRLVGAALLTGVVASLLLMAPILFLASHAPG